MAIQGSQAAELAAKGILWCWPADAGFDQFNDYCKHERRPLVFLQYEFERDVPNDEKSSLRLKFWVPGVSKFRMYCEPQRILLHFQSHDLVFCRQHDGIPERTVFEFALSLSRPCLFDSFKADGGKNLVELTTYDESSTSTNSKLFELETPSSPKTLRRQRLTNGTDENNPVIGPLLPKDKFMPISGADGLYSYELLLTLPRGVLMEARDAIRMDDNLLRQRKKLQPEESLGDTDADSGRNVSSSQLILPAGGESKSKYIRVMESINREKEALVWAKSELPYRIIGLDRQSLADIRSFYQKKLQLSKCIAIQHGKEPLSADFLHWKPVSPVYRTGNSNHGYTGIDNVGNSCFMSCVLQALCNTREFRDYFLSNVYEIERNPGNPLASEGCGLLHRFAEFMNELWFSNCSSIKPTGLRRYIADKNEIFGGYGQQDAQEFLQFLLDGLHEDLNRVKKKVPTGDIDYKGKSDEQLFRETHQQMLKWQDSVVMDLFYGFFKNTMECLTCNEVSTKFDPFLFLPLPLPEPQQHVSVMYMPYHVTQPPPTSADPIVYKFELSFGRQDKVSAIFDLISQHCNVESSFLRAVVVRGPTLRIVLEPHEVLSRVELRHDLNDTIYVFQSRCPKDFDELRNGSVREIYIIQKLAAPRPQLPKLMQQRLRGQNSAKAACNACGCNVSATRRCTVCRSVSYCSNECQKADWQQHKLQCMPYKRLLTSMPLFICIHVNEMQSLWIMIGQKLAQFDTVVIKSLVVEPLLPTHATGTGQTIRDDAAASRSSGSSDDTEMVMHDGDRKATKRPSVNTHSAHIVASGAESLSPSPPASTAERGNGGGGSSSGSSVQADSGIASETQSECDSVSGVVGLMPPQAATNSEAFGDATLPVVQRVANGAAAGDAGMGAEKSAERTSKNSTSPKIEKPVLPMSPPEPGSDERFSFWQPNNTSFYSVEEQRPYHLIALHPDYLVAIVRGEVQFAPGLQQVVSSENGVSGTILHGECIVDAADVFDGDPFFLLEWKTNEIFQHSSADNKTASIPSEVVWVDTRVDMPIVEDASCRLRREELVDAETKRRTEAEKQQAQGDSFSSSFNNNFKPSVGRHNSLSGSSSSSSSAYKLIDLFDHFTRPEILRSHDEAWKCPKCNTRGESVKRLRLWSLPTILIVQLKRFSDQQQGSMMSPLMASFYSSAWQTQRVKKNDMVEYPHVLDLSGCCVENDAQHDSSDTENSDENRYLYDLYAIVFHHGQAHYGHYTAACRLYSFPDTSSDIIPWRSCDDNVVTTVNTSSNRFSNNELFSRNAYLLFYRRRQYRATIHLGGYRMTLPTDMRDVDALDEDDELPSTPPASPSPTPLLSAVDDVPSGGGLLQGPMLPPNWNSSHSFDDDKTMPKIIDNSGIGEEYAGHGYHKKRSIDGNDDGLPSLIPNTSSTLPPVDNVMDGVFMDDREAKPAGGGGLLSDAEWPCDKPWSAVEGYGNARRRAVDYSSQAAEQFNRLYDEGKADWQIFEGYRKNHEDPHSDYDSDDPNNNMIDGRANAMSRSPPEQHVHNISPECKAQFLYDNSTGVAHTDDLERRRNLSGGRFNSDVAAICAQLMDSAAGDEEEEGTGSDVVKPTPLFTSPDDVMTEAMARQISDDSGEDENTLLEHAKSLVGAHSPSRGGASHSHIPSLSRQDLLLRSSRSPQMDKFMESLPSSNRVSESSPIVPPINITERASYSNDSSGARGVENFDDKSDPVADRKAGGDAVRPSSTADAMHKPVSPVNNEGGNNQATPEKTTGRPKKAKPNRRSRVKARKCAMCAPTALCAGDGSKEDRKRNTVEEPDSTSSFIVNGGHPFKVAKKEANLDAASGDDGRSIAGSTKLNKNAVTDGSCGTVNAGNKERLLNNDENIEHMD